jgi:hypothetical protein
MLALKADKEVTYKISLFGELFPVFLVKENPSKLLHLDEEKCDLMGQKKIPIDCNFFTIATE